MALVDPLTRLSLPVGLILSLVSASSTTSLLVWFTVGTHGIFWGSLSDRQYVYFSIVIVTVFLAICMAWLCQLNAVAFVGASALGGYVGSFLAYCYFDWTAMEKMVNKSHYYVLIRPFVLPTHLIFIVAGAVAALLMLVLCRAYVAMLAPEGSP
jgi:succinate-acetate transporter protein